MRAVRWRQDQAALGGVRLAWQRAGAGPAVVYLHDAGADTLASTAFDDLTRDHDVVLVDLPGYGRSGPPDGVRDAADVAAAIAALSAELDLAPATVVGTSLGGWFAVELALTAPARVAALVLCAAAGLHVPEDYLFALFAQGRAAASTQDLITAALLGRLPFGEQDVATRPAAVAAAVVAPWVQNLAAAAAASWSPATANPRLLGRLPGVGCPTLVLWGEADALIPLQHGRVLAEAIPGACLQVVPGSGHLVALERPAVFAAAIRRMTARDRR